MRVGSLSTSQWELFNVRRGFRRASVLGDRFWESMEFCRRNWIRVYLGSLSGGRNVNGPMRKDIVYTNA